MNTRDPNRMKFLALKLRAGVPFTEAEQREWDQGAHLGDKVTAGLPLTPEEQAKIERAKDARVSVRGGAVWVDAPTMTVEDWKAHVSKSRAAPAKLVADALPLKDNIAGTDKPQT
ncbi:MAG: hypothetical protein EDM82_05845 [Cyanobacteria bacterium CYA]|nr:MAG: hypothetical protein EDM82_05845 [Cyanobacteria bacterium CYA]